MHQKHFISHPDQTSHTRSRIKTTVLQTSNHERSKLKIVSYTRARENNTCFVMTDVTSSFSPEVKKSHSSLHWDCTPFFVECNQSENQFKENLKTSNKMKEAKKENKSDLASCYFLLHMLFSLALCMCM